MLDNVGEASERSRIGGLGYGGNDIRDAGSASMIAGAARNNYCL